MMRLTQHGRLLHLYGSERGLDLLSKDLVDMLENTRDAICVADGESRILLLNPAFEKVMGLRIADAVGNKISDLVKKGASDTAASIKIMQTGRPETVFIRTAAGRQVVSCGVPVYDNAKRIRRIFCNLRDVADLAPAGIGPLLAIKKLAGASTHAGLAETPPNIVARSDGMRKVIALAKRMGAIDSTVLILGETGVGKDVVARFIHDQSRRFKTGRFVKVSCGAMPEQLLESELFGYAPGAFTGASKKGKKGYLESAHNGTLFLDEIGELPLWLQVKLLSVLQDRIFTRVGGTTPSHCDFRMIAATNRDLEDMVAKGAFRKDLFYRLNVVPLKIPALKKRRNDIAPLMDHFRKRFNAQYHLKARFSDAVVQALGRYNWPGNVRELENLVERMMVTNEKSLIDLDHLPSRYRVRSDTSDRLSAEFTLKTAVKQFELNLIDQALRRTDSYEEAAASLGISLSTLARRIRLLRRCGADGHF